MIAGIVLVALGLKKTLEHTLDPLGVIVSAALFGGVALYLLAHVLFRWRNVHRFSVHRLLVALLALASVPLVAAMPATIALATLTGLLVGLIVYEVVRFADLRTRLRSELRHGV